MVRKTWHYDPELKKMVEGPSPRRWEGSGDGWKYNDRFYADNPFKAHDGTIIDSRKKHRDYMKRHNLTTIDDMTGVWEKAAKERANFFQGKHDKAQRRQDIIDAINRRSK